MGDPDGTTGPEAGAGRTAVVVVNYDSAGLLRDNLAALTRADPSLRAVVVDNRSNDAALRAVTELAAAEGWRLVVSPENVGFGAGMNLGVAEARRSGRDRFLLLNPDATIAIGDLRLLEGRLERNPRSLLAPLIVRPDGSVWSAGGTVDLVHGRTRSVPAAPGDPWAWISGACVLTSAEVWDLTGGFDDDYFLYWEDVDLSVRAAAAGIDVAVVDSARAVHDEGGTHADGAGERLSWTYYYFNIRNRLLFAAKLLPTEDRRRWSRTAVRESYRILLRGSGRRIFLRPIRPLGCAVRGLRDGWRDGRAVLRSRAGRKDG